MVSERSLKVLHAIVTDYVANSEPVGSKSIAQRYGVGVSAATIRNDMVALEEAELIAAPHTSAGRVPTDKGYRLYVDTLAAVQPLSLASRAAIERFLGEAHDLDEALGRAVRLLAQLTKQVAVIQYPELERAAVRQLELVRLSEQQLLTVVISDDGTVTQQQLTLPATSISDEYLVTLKELISSWVVGVPAQAAHARLKRESTQLIAHPDSLTATQLRLLAAVSAAVGAQLRVNHPEKLKVAGIANLPQAATQLTQTAKVLEALEEQVTLLKLFNELRAVPCEGEMRAAQLVLRASIGRENEPYGLPDTAVVTADYFAAPGTGSQLGVLGPIRMDYAANMAAVRAVARYLSKLLGEG